MTNVRYLEAPIQTSPLGRHKPPMLRYRPPRPVVKPVWSHTASWEDLAYLQAVEPADGLALGWGHRWSVAYKHGRSMLTESAATVSAGDLLAANPMLTNSWHQNKTARAGVRYLDSTGELHAHASMFERKTLLLLDFHGATAVAAQPFTLTYEHAGRVRHHTPDFLAWVDGVLTVINCRPATLVKPRLLEDVAALEAICLSRGWDNTLVVGYPPPSFAAIDTWTAHSTSDDILGYSENITDLLANGPLRFDELTAGFEATAASRAVAQLLLWDRELSANIAEPFDDDTLIYLPQHVPGGVAA